MKLMLSKIKRKESLSVGKHHSKKMSVSARGVQFMSRFDKFVPLFTAGVARKTKLGKWEAKDLRKRLLVMKTFWTRLFVWSLVRTLTLPVSYRLLRLNSLYTRTAAKAVVNRCMMSERSHGVEVWFALSRIVLRELMAMGSLHGIRKASW